MKHVTLEEVTASASSVESGTPLEEVTTASARVKRHLSKVDLFTELEKFRLERDADRTSQLKVVATVGFWTFASSVTLWLAAHALHHLAGADVWGVGSPICAFIGAIATVILSSIDETYFDYNMEFTSHLKLRLTFWPFLCLFSLTRLFDLLDFEGLDIQGKVMMAIVLASAALQVANSLFALRGASFPKQTSLCSCQFQLLSVDAVIIEYLYSQPTREAEPCARRARGLELFVFGAFVIVAFQAFYFRRQIQWQCKGRMVASPQKLMYYSWYLFLFIRGSLNSISGIRMLALSCSTKRILPVLFTALACLLPFSMVVLLPTNLLFLWVARRFDNDLQRSHRDGAFLASLLDSVVVAPGDTMWVHRGRDDTRYDHSDPRRSWEKGVVVSVADEIIVHTSASASSYLSWGHILSTNSIDSHDDTTEATGVRRVASPSALPIRVASPSALPTGVGRVALPSAFPSSVRKVCSKDSDSSENRASIASMPSTSRHKVHRLPLPGSGQTADEILKHAQANLRCIEWKHMSEEFMSSNKFADKVEDLSRFVRPGERIDYFLSHSWHDDPKLKWQCLTSIAKQFYRAHSRYPTFWLDKACINQKEISDGLKVLPVNVMACRKLLVCCGETYVERLWCIWEIYTLFSFAREERAAERLKLVPFGGAEVLEQLKRFDARKARCYDPNEEARLMNIIRAGDLKLFNNKIVRLAVALEKSRGSTSSSTLTQSWALTASATSSVLGHRFFRSISERGEPECNVDHVSSEASDRLSVESAAVQVHGGDGNGASQSEEDAATFGRVSSSDYRRSESSEYSGYSLEEASLPENQTPLARRCFDL